MANMGRALLAGLVGGFGQYAGMKMDEKTKAEQAERDQKLAQLQMQLKQSEAKFSESLKAPQYQTIKDTGPDGVTRERTVKSSYDAANGRQEQDVGSAIIPTKDERSAFEREQQMYKDDPAGYAAFKRAGERPLLGSQGGVNKSDSISFEDYNAMTPEQKAAFDRYKGRAQTNDEDGRLKKIAVAQVNSRIKDIDKKSSFMQDDDYNAYGIDKTAKDARKQLRNAVTSEIYGSYGIDAPVEPSVEVTDAGPGSNNAPPALFPDKQAKPKDAKAGSSQSNPIKVSSAADVAKQPAGAWITFPNGTTRQK